MRSLGRGGLRTCCSDRWWTERGVIVSDHWRRRFPVVARKGIALETMGDLSLCGEGWRRLWMAVMGKRHLAGGAAPELTVIRPGLAVRSCLRRRDCGGFCCSGLRGSGYGVSGLAGLTRTVSGRVSWSRTRSTRVLQSWQVMMWWVQRLWVWRGWNTSMRVAVVAVRPVVQRGQTAVRVAVVAISTPGEVSWSWGAVMVWPGGDVGGRGFPPFLTIGLETVSMQ